MRQALHIFRKDVRRLRWEILGALALVAAFVDSGSQDAIQRTAHHRHSTSIRQRCSRSHGIGTCPSRVIHGEALPGHKQFWLTRPYSWKSLLAAKALFVLVFVTLPMMIADAVIVAAEGFRVGSHWGGLIWEQLLWWLLFVIPAWLALAAVTRGLVEFVSWLLLLIGALYTWCIFSEIRPETSPRVRTLWQWPHCSSTFWLSSAGLLRRYRSLAVCAAEDRACESCDCRCLRGRSAATVFPRGSQICRSGGLVEDPDRRLQAPHHLQSVANHRGA